VVFIQAEERFALMGDVLFRGSVGRTDLPGGDYAALIRSIKDKILPLGDDLSFLPGHGPASTVGEERVSNPFLR
jgi:glyoxylase-like metal-dependent hydrolase (beta-lactamase superfamily II)